MATHDFKKFPELTDAQMQTLYFESPHQQIREDFWGRCIKVHDGDTIRIRCDFRDFDFPVRLGEIAAPELNEEGGEEARDWLRDRILNRDIQLRIDKRNRIEKWGRLLAFVYEGGICVNDELVNHNLAIWWDDRLLVRMPKLDKDILDKHGFKNT